MNKKLSLSISLALGSIIFSNMLLADNSSHQRSRDLGIPFEGTPGPLNSITDVKGVEVGQVTLIKGEGKLNVGVGPIRTGVTTVLPRGKSSASPVTGGYFNLNGNGEMTGTAYLQDFGVIYGPIGLSNTNAIGQLYAGTQQWTSEKFGAAIWPVSAETWDGRLNDIEGFHVKTEHVKQAIDNAATSKVEEGNVGGGTGMVCFGFKGGIGSSSREVKIADETYTVGVLVQCNTGEREVLRIAGAPIGQELAKKWLSCIDPKYPPTKDHPNCTSDGDQGKATKDEGSIIIVVATDAPLSPIQLNRVAKRASMGLARLGSFAGNGSGDLIVSFSTTSPANDSETEQATTSAQFPNSNIDGIFRATVEATEESIVNALVAAETMTGVDGLRFYGLPHAETVKLLKKYNRLETK